MIPPEQSIDPEKGWIEWNGGECPVDPDAHIVVRYRDGWEQRWKLAISEPDWSHMRSDPPGDIIAYRVVTP